MSGATRDDARMEDCFCKTPFYHVRFPSIGATALRSAPSWITHDLNDNVYTKSNSTDFGLTLDGKLYVKRPGTYLLYYDVLLEGVDGDCHASLLEAMVKVETPNGHAPYRAHPVKLMHIPIAEAVLRRQARFHSTVMIHVGDVAYGVDSYGATLTFRTQASGGAFTYGPEIHATLTKL